jgi:hypothetical protein
VRIELGDRFADERKRFRLACACEQCAHFEVASCGCANGYPNATHREQAFAARIASGTFCKEFELA